MYTQWWFIALHTLVFSAGAIPYCNRPELSNDRIFPCLKTSCDAVRVLSYNIRGDSAIDAQHGNAWEVRRGKIHYLVQHYEPDVIGLQGVSKRYMPYLKEVFACYTSIAFDANDETYDAVLFVRTDRFEVKDSHHFYLSCDTRIAPGAARSRVAVCATLFDRKTHKTCVVCSAHFESRGMESRINNARILTEQLAKTPLTIPMILVGDFNFFVGNLVYAEKSQQAYALIAQNLQVHDVRDLSDGNHYGPDGTWIGWPYDTHAVVLGTVGERLDGIFVRECCVIQEGVLNLKVKEGAFMEPFQKEFNATLYPSDHLPLIADVITG